MISSKLICLAIFLLVAYGQKTAEDGGKTNKVHSDTPSSTEETVHFNNSYAQPNTLHSHSVNQNQRYSARIAGSRHAINRPVFGIRTFPLGEIHPTDDFTKAKAKVSSTTETVLDFRIEGSKKGLREGKSINSDDDDDNENYVDDENYLETDDLVKASAGGGKQKKEADDDEEKTLAQQVADGKYGLIQNELFANGSKRPGILSYKSNSEVPKDTKENLGGLDKDEIWLAEDHILVLRGGNYQGTKENEVSTPSPTQIWPPIDNYIAPKRQVKIPKNPEIPPPFPVQLIEDGPVEFIRGQNNPSFLPPVIPPLPPFIQDSNKTIPLPFTVVPIPPLPDIGNKSLPLPPHLLPPFLQNLPPGATFVAPPDNKTDIDEDDPSIYYPPKYDFYYPLDNSTAVPPGPLVPGIILPPPPDFFSLWKPGLPSDNRNETDDSINAVTPNSFVGPKYLPALRKPTRTRTKTNNNYTKRPKLNVTNSIGAQDAGKFEKPGITYVYPENSKSKPITTTTPTYTTLRTSNKMAPNKYSDLNAPVFLPGDPEKSLYHPLPTTSPKPNHITLPPTTKSLPKHILIITTPQSTNKNKVESGYAKAKPVKTDYSDISPEIHPLRSLIKPNVTVSYNGKYGHLPPPVDFKPAKPETDVTIIRGHYVTQTPSTKGTKVPSTDVNSITVTPVPVVKKLRLQSTTTAERPEVSVPSSPPSNPTKATFYFYEEMANNKEAEKTRELVTRPPTPAEGKPEVKLPVTPYYYTTHSTSKTPIRQFLEETFHSSNVLPRKPQITHVNNAEIITHNGYSDLPKMKHLNYGTPISSPRPIVKYHYVTDGNTVIIPTPKIKDLEIKNPGTSGLQTVHLNQVPAGPAPKPATVESYVASSEKPKETKEQPLPPITTPSPVEYNTADGPFIPSNYYATVGPEHVHFTSQEQTLVDDITKNYFTIFGQKLNLPSTTPLIPVKPAPAPAPVKTKQKQESGLSYISEDGRNFKIQQVHENADSRKPSKSTSSFYTREKTKPPQTTRPPSNFEKYLKELTGEDQRDYIISGVFPVKIKKGKGHTPDGIPIHLLQQHPLILQNAALLARPQIQYQPNLSTTLQPITNVEIKPQYVQQILPPRKPYSVFQPESQAQNVAAFSPHFQQYLQELTGFSSPPTQGQAQTKRPNGNIIENTAASRPYKVSDGRPKPVSLENDFLVNYKGSRPEIDPSAEIVNIPGQPPYDNIKVVESPDLTRNPNLPYPLDIFQNLHKPDFFSQTHSNGGNAFVSYNLPGNGGHFYFLTPQIADKVIERDNSRRREKVYKRINRSHEKLGRRHTGTDTGFVPDQIEKSSDSGYSNTDYLRRRRKKP